MSIPIIAPMLSRSLQRPFQSQTTPNARRGNTANERPSIYIDIDIYFAAARSPAPIERFRLWQPGDGADLVEPLAQRGPGLAAVLAAIELAQRGGGKDQIGIGWVGGQEIDRALDRAGQPNILPCPSAVAAAIKPPRRAGRAVTVGQKHDVGIAGLAQDAAGVLPW